MTSTSAPTVTPVFGAATSRVTPDRATATNIARSTKLRITARGRRVVLALIAVPLAVGIGFLALGGGDAVASDENTTIVDFETLTVMPGDTLWGIAAEVAPHNDTRDVVASISRLNQLHGGTLHVGQSISIPLEYTR